MRRSQRSLRYTAQSLSVSSLQTTLEMLTHLGGLKQSHQDFRKEGAVVFQKSFYLQLRTRKQRVVPINSSFPTRPLISLLQPLWANSTCRKSLLSLMQNSKFRRAGQEQRNLNFNADTKNGEMKNVERRMVKKHAISIGNSLFNKQQKVATPSVNMK